MKNYITQDEDVVQRCLTIQCSQTFVYTLKMVTFHVPVVMAKAGRSGVGPHIVNHGTNEVTGERRDPAALTPV